MDKAWLEERKTGIGGSDAGAVCGVSGWKTPLQVWNEKMGLTGPQEDNPAMFWGRALEPVVRQKYSDETGRAVLIPKGMLRHPDYPFMLANLDGFTEDGRLVEIKTAGYSFGWGENGTDDIPINYLLQVQHYMAVTGLKVTDMPVLIGGQDFRIYEIPEDKQIQKLIINRESAFWSMVEAGTPPDPESYREIKEFYKNSEASRIVASGEVEAALERLIEARKTMKDLEEEEEAAKRIIMLNMGASDTLVSPAGVVLATWKSGKPPKRFDAKGLEMDLPETYRLYLKEGEPVRRLLIKEDKK